MTRMDAIRETAYHEAGHAVLRWRNWFTFLEPGVFVDHRAPLSKSGCATHGNFTSLPCFASVMRQLSINQKMPHVWKGYLLSAERETESLLAGALAQQKYVGITDMRYFTQFKDCTKAENLWYHIYAAEMGRSEPDRKDLPWKRVQSTLRKIGEQTYRLLSRRNYWRAVERLAAELIRVGRVSPADAEKTIFLAGVRPIGCRP